MTAYKYLLRLIVLTLPLASAHADQIYNFSRFTCVPELNFFAIDHFSIWNLARGAYMDNLDVRPGADAHVAKTYSIYGYGALAHRPYHCRIPETLLEQGYDNARPALDISVSQPDPEGPLDVVINGHSFGGGFTYFSAAPDGVPGRLSIRRCQRVGETEYSSVASTQHSECHEQEYDLKTQVFLPR